MSRCCEVVGLDLERARASVDPRTFALLCSLVLDVLDEDGEPMRWGHAAKCHHVEFALALLTRDGPPFRWLSGAKGTAKSSTGGAAALAMIASGEAPAGAHLATYAADLDQARLVFDSAAGMVRRTPGLVDLVDVQSRRLTSRTTGAYLTVEPADPEGAHGLRAWFQILDERAWWRQTRGPEQLWQLAIAAVPKTPGSRLAVITTAGQPGSTAHEAFEWARAGVNGWGLVHLPGVTPGVDLEVLEAARASMSPASYRRLWMNEWASDDGAALDPEDVAAVLTLAAGEDLPAVGGHVLAADLSTSHDSTVIMVAHLEQLPGDSLGVAVVDAVRVWTPTPGRPVDLIEVRETLDELLTRYRPVRAQVDKHQAVSLVQELKPRHPILEAVPVTPKLNHEITTSLLRRMGTRTLRAPALPLLRHELERTHLATKPDGSLRLTKRNTSNDAVWTLGLALSMLERSAPSRVASARGRTMPGGRR